MLVVWLDRPRNTISVRSVIVTAKAKFRTLFGPPSWKHLHGKALRACFSQSEHQTRWRSHYMQLLKWGVVGVFVSAAVSVSVVWWELGSRKHQNLSSICMSTDITTSIPSPNSPYIYLWRQPMAIHRGALYKNENTVLFPWLQSKSHDPWTLLQMCQSSNKAVHYMGVQAVASKTWDEFQYRYVAQAADARTLIGLARTQGSNSKFFLSMPSLVPNEMPLVEQLASLVVSMENFTGKNRTPQGAAALAIYRLQHKPSATEEKHDRFWMFSGSSLDVTPVDAPIPDESLEVHFLQTISEMTISAELAVYFVNNQGLAALQQAVDDRQDSQTMLIVATILGNLALYPVLHKNIVRTGWLGVLKSWVEGSNTALAVAAGRALANLDRNWTSDVLEDGILLLHPLYRSRKTVHADIIFVHGLLGGGVKTWRQQDPGASPEPQSHPRSQCWPKDWLAEDCPHVRILSLHYNTALSSWMGLPVANQEKSLLEGRSRDLLSKLHRAGVGHRPVIWVGHSMGGLLIKKMLQLASQDERYINMRDNTCGVLLYSVPHRGLSLAALSIHAHYLLYPSPEVQELSRDSPHLSQLHKHFKEFVQTKNIPCLSFGELKKTQIRKTLPKVLLVPPESSDPEIGEFYKMPLDHISICKPSSCDSELYEKTLAFVHRCIFLSYMHRLRQGVAGTGS